MALVAGRGSGTCEESVECYAPFMEGDINRVRTYPQRHIAGKGNSFPSPIMIHVLLVDYLSNDDVLAHYGTGTYVQ